MSWGRKFTAHALLTGKCIGNNEAPVKKINISELEKNPAAVFRRMKKGEAIPVVRRGVVLAELILREEYVGAKTSDAAKPRHLRTKKSGGQRSQKSQKQIQRCP